MYGDCLCMELRTSCIQWNGALRRKMLDEYYIQILTLRWLKKLKIHRGIISETNI
jgi:hypothetical protein